MSTTQGPPAALTRSRDLKRMQGLATALLVLMAVVFVLAGAAAHRWSAAGYLQAFAEAAMVGACADWFAVTALFRRPLGLPIPHTGVIPRNKDRIGRALGDFIAENFLTESVLDERLDQVELARWGGEWLGQGDNAKRLSRRITDLLPDILAALPPDALRTLAGSALVAAARAAPAAAVLSGLVSFAWRGGHLQPLIERGAERLRAYLQQHQEVILEKVQSQSYRWLPAWIDRAIANKINAGVLQLLDDVCDPAHPWRVRLDQSVEGWIERLASDPELRARLEALKAGLVEDEELRRGLETIWRQLEADLGGRLRENSDEMALRIEAALVSAGAWLRDNAEVQAALNAWARATVSRVIAPRRHDIGGFVAKIVEGWDAKSVVERLELQVGRDLQYIRINGTLVGGLVGLLIYAVSRAFGL